MDDCIKWIDFNGKKIMFCDFSNFDEQQYMDGVDLMEQELLKQSRGSCTPQILDVTNSHMTQKTSERGKQTVKVLSEAEITTNTAMVGISGVKRIIAKAISRDVFFAKDMQSAKEWVISQE